MENIFVFNEILFKMLLFKGGVLIYAEHCILEDCIYIVTFIYLFICLFVCLCLMLLLLFSFSGTEYNDQPQHNHNRSDIA